MRPLLYLIISISTLVSSAQSLREIYQQGVTAYDEKNYELFKEKMFTIDTMRPNYPAVVYNLACGYALTNQPEMSLKTLNQYILMDATQDFTEDKDFASLLALPGFVQIQQKQEQLTQTIEVAEQLTYPLLAIHPEAITFSETQDAFFIGGVKDGNIWKVRGDYSPELWAESPKNSWSVMGLEVSPDEKTLWVCTTSMTQYQDYDQNEDGFASVLKYDLKSGKLLETIALPGGHNFGDLISDNKGNIYISDGTANMVYWINSESGKLEVHTDLSEIAFSLQGLTLTEDQRTLYLSDYIDGIYKLNLTSKNVTKLKIDADDVLIKGIDGIYYKDGALIGLHNGTNPNRVVRYLLSKNGDKITGKEILAQGGMLGEPTQGVWIDGDLYFVGNSPWGAYDRDGNFSPDSKALKIGIIK